MIKKIGQNNFIYTDFTAGNIPNFTNFQGGPLAAYCKLAEYTVPKLLELKIKRIDFSVSLEIQRFIRFLVIENEMSISDDYFMPKSSVDEITVDYTALKNSKIKFYIGCTEIIDELEENDEAAGNILFYANLECVLRKVS